MGCHGGLPKPQQLVLHRLDSSGVEALGRQQRLPVALLDTQHHVAAAEIVKVVGEGADGVQHALRIPSGLVLDALALDGALAQQIVKVDRKVAGHVVVSGVLRFPVFRGVPRFVTCAPSALILSRRTEAGSSLGFCATSWPEKALFRIDCRSTVALANCTSISSTALSIRESSASIRKTTSDSSAALPTGTRRFPTLEMLSVCSPEVELASFTMRLRPTGESRKWRTKRGSDSVVNRTLIKWF